MKWTDEEINYLKILLKDKKSLNEIAEAFEAQHHNETLGFIIKDLEILLDAKWAE